MRAEQLNDGQADADLDLNELLQIQARTEATYNDRCVNLPLEDILRGPGHVAWKLIQDIKDDPDNWSKLGESICRASKAHARRSTPCASYLTTSACLAW